MEIVIPVCASIQQEGAHYHLSCKRTGGYSDEFRNACNMVETEVWKASSPHLPLTVASARKAM
jgi:hypothetical protein